MKFLIRKISNLGELGSLNEREVGSADVVEIQLLSTSRIIEKNALHNFLLVLNKSEYCFLLFRKQSIS